jgi:hypothetical protein
MLGGLEGWIKYFVEVAPVEKKSDMFWMFRLDLGIRNRWA